MCRSSTSVSAYDPEKAKALLAEAGYPDGFGFTMVCDNNVYVNEEEICQAVSAMWARIGLKPSLDTAPTSIQTVKFESGKFDVGILGWANEPMIDSYSILVQVRAFQDRHLRRVQLGRLEAMPRSTR